MPLKRWRLTHSAPLKPALATFRWKSCGRHRTRACGGLHLKRKWQIQAIRRKNHLKASGELRRLNDWQGRCVTLAPDVKGCLPFGDLVAPHGQQLDPATLHLAPVVPVLPFGVPITNDDAARHGA
jgi:hypothetical protein